MADKSTSSTIQGSQGTTPEYAKTFGVTPGANY